MPFGDNMMMGGDMEQMPMGDMPMQGDMGMDPMAMDGENQFDTNFDAGVEADENADPKKYIQQLTGKLSQSLRNYNDGQPQADADLNKYVAGMIVKQAIEGLSPEDVQEVLGKIKSNDNGETEQPLDNNQPMDNQQPMDDEMSGEPQPPFDGMESRQRSKSRKQVNETMTLDDDEDVDALGKQHNPKRKSGYRTKPFRL